MTMFPLPADEPERRLAMRAKGLARMRAPCKPLDDELARLTADPSLLGPQLTLVQART